MKDFLSRKFEFKITPVTITLVAMFTALATVFNFIDIRITPALKLSLQYIPISLAAAITGPIGGAVTGGLADIIGFLLKPDGTYMPFFTISGMLEGIVMGLFLYNAKKRTPLNVVFSRAVVNIFIYFVLNSIWLLILLGRPSVVAMLPVRALKVTIGIVIETVILTLLLPILSKITEKFNVFIGFTKKEHLEKVD